MKAKHQHFCISILKRIMQLCPPVWHYNINKSIDIAIHSIPIPAVLTWRDRSCTTVEKGRAADMMAYCRLVLPTCNSGYYKMR